MNYHLKNIWLDANRRKIEAREQEKRAERAARNKRDPEHPDYDPVFDTAETTE